LIYFWIIRSTDGTVYHDFPYEAILENLKVANQYFKPMGICFILKGYNYINSSEIYELTDLSSIVSYVNNTNNNYRIPNCFNVYLPNSLLMGNGVTNYGRDQLVVTQRTALGHWDHRKGFALAHELAHDFDIRHVWGSNNNGDSTNEHVTRNPNDPNYNALITGDDVHDTPAMINFTKEAQQNNVSIEQIINHTTCTYMGTKTDAIGVPFSITPTDVGNLMGSSPHKCLTKFTTGQGIRMREFIRDNPNSQAVKAKRANPVALDLCIKDSPDDFGAEPNVTTINPWNSRDMWIRRNNDGGTEPQNPEYHPTKPNYIYVRVTNKGCDTSTGTEQLKVYWSKADTSLSWPVHWNGSTFPNTTIVRGNMISTKNIPVLKPGEETIIVFPWITPNPNNYALINPNPWHFCFLARIDTPADPMAINETATLMSNVRNNNNIAWKNVTIVDLEPNSFVPAGGVVGVGNYFTQPRRFDLIFRTDSNETGSRIFDEAEVSFTLSTTLINAWSVGGRMVHNIIQTGLTNLK